MAIMCHGDEVVILSREFAGDPQIREWVRLWRVRDDIMYIRQLWDLSAPGGLPEIEQALSDVPVGCFWLPTWELVLAHAKEARS